MEKDNNVMRSRLDELKKNQDLPSTLDAVEKVLDSLSIYLVYLASVGFHSYFNFS
jgi:hypothetical protein